MTQRIEFTKAAIRAIRSPAQGTRATLYDAKIPKLAVRVTSTGTRTFYVVKRTDARHGVGEARDVPGHDDRTSTQGAEKTLGQFADGTDPAQAKRTERAQMTLGDAFEDYIQRHSRLKVRNAARTSPLWERCLGDLPDAPKKKHAPRNRTKHPAGVNWQRRKVNAISRDDVATLHIAIGKTTPTLANRVVELLSAIYNKLRDSGVAVDNPAHGVEPFMERSATVSWRAASCRAFSLPSLPDSIATTSANSSRFAADRRAPWERARDAMGRHRRRSRGMEDPGGRC